MSAADHILDIAAEWLVAHPRRIALFLCACLAAPCWIERILP